jgi:hypothetical protein
MKLIFREEHKNYANQIQTHNWMKNINIHL